MQTLSIAEFRCVWASESAAVPSSGLSGSGRRAGPDFAPMR